VAGWFKFADKQAQLALDAAEAREKAGKAKCGPKVRKTPVGVLAEVWRGMKVNLFCYIWRRNIRTYEYIEQSFSVVFCLFVNDRMTEWCVVLA